MGSRRPQPATSPFLGLRGLLTKGHGLEESRGYASSPGVPVHVHPAVASPGPSKVPSPLGSRTTISRLLARSSSFLFPHAAAPPATQCPRARMRVSPPTPAPARDLSAWLLSVILDPGSLTAHRSRDVRKRCPILLHLGLCVCDELLGEADAEGPGTHWAAGVCRAIGLELRPMVTEGLSPCY